jgi:hypothetical protein
MLPRRPDTDLSKRRRPARRMCIGPHRAGPTEKERKMPDYLLVYRAPRGHEPGGEGTAEAWQQFMQGIAPSIVDPGNPVFDRRETGAGANGGTVVGGYSIVRAGDLDAAVELAGGCPFLREGGAVEVGEITPMSIDLPAAAATRTGAAS